MAIFYLLKDAVFVIAITFIGIDLHVCVIYSFGELPSFGKPTFHFIIPKILSVIMNSAETNY